jgi:hypothetical protein
VTHPTRISHASTAAMVVLAFLGAGLTSARALDPETVRVHGTLREAPDSGSVTIEMPEGIMVSGRWAPEMRVIGVKRASLADIHEGSYVGTAALPGPAGTLRALEVHIFPESMRGAGDGHRLMDGGRDQTMTNGAVGTVSSTGPLTIILTYKGGMQRVIVDPDTPVVALEPGDASLLAIGTKVIASGRRDGNEATFDRVLVGLEGLDPPM